MTAAAAPAALPFNARLCLQVNTSEHGTVWRDVIQFPREDDLACANVIAAAPLLAAAAGPDSALRITTEGLTRHVLCTWSRRAGWRGTLFARGAQ